MGLSHHESKPRHDGSHAAPRKGRRVRPTPADSFFITLDALCDMFDVIPHDRHTASGDAFLTAQVFLRLLRLAARHGRTTLSRISEPFVEQAK